MQEIFHVGPFLGDAANALDLSDLFDPGAIPKAIELRVSRIGNCGCGTKKGTLRPHFHLCLTLETHEARTMAT